ncbi:MAG: hypothetical protein ACI88L_000611 [Candidatus Paceibacteria bacterium]|jgi:hypothetical protein
MGYTKLFYKKSNRLGFDFYKLYREDTEAHIKNDNYECDLKDKDQTVIKSVSVRIASEKKEGEIKSIVWIKISGCGNQKLSEKDLEGYSFDFKRKYIMLMVSKRIKGHEGFNVICDKETKKPIPGGEVASPGFMRFFNGFHPEIEIPISYKVEVDTATKKWKLLVAERGSRSFVEISSRKTDYDVKSYGSHEFHFI